MMNKWTISILISCLAVFSVQAEVLDEWAFESDDVAGTTLNGATNIGSAGSTFAAGGAGVLETDGTSLLTSTPVSGALWSDDTAIDASIDDEATGIHYLRYDLEYDVSGDSTASSALGISFVNGSAVDDLSEVGMALAYDSIGTTTSDEAVKVSEDLALTGTLIAIAELDLDQTPATMRIWYGTDADTFSADSPSYETTVDITSISDLRVRASGDSTNGDGDYIRVENLRRADSWDDIVSAIPDYTADPLISLTLEDSLGGVMRKGATNEVSVILTGSISLATNLTTTLTGDGLTISLQSTGATTLQPYEVTTNVYEVVAPENGIYVLTAQAYVAGVANGAASTLNLSVGESVSTSYVVQNDVGGSFDGTVEPGETFDVVVTNINDGVKDILDMTTSLTAVNTVYFPNLPLEQVTSIITNETNIITYTVNCSADTPDGDQVFKLVNQTADSIWEYSFTTEVKRVESFAVSTNDISLVVLDGETATFEVTIANTGNAAFDFTVTDEGMPFQYTVTTQQVDHVDFLGAQDGLVEFDSSDSTNSVTMDLAKDFSLFGSTCNQFSVGRDGTVSMMADGVEVGSIFPYQTTNTLVDASSIHAVQSGSELIVAWGTEIIENGAFQEFQARINTNGTIQYYYESGDWDEAEMGVSDAATDYELSTTIDPDQLSSMGFKLSPEQWVSYSLSDATLEVGGTQLLTISADASLATGTDGFTLSIVGGETSEEITVSVSVEALSQSLTVTPPTGWVGPAGLWSINSDLVVSNSGNVAIGVTVEGGSYGVESTDYTWVDTRVLSPMELTESQLGSESVELGFTFSFYGASFTNVTVNLGGTLTLDDGIIISPFGTDLEWDDAESSVSYLKDAIHKRFTVTWGDVLIADSSDYQTFQAVLSSSGDITCNYKELNGAWYDASIGLTGTGSVEGTLISDLTLGETNIVTTVTTLSTNDWTGFVSENDPTSTTNTVVTTNSVVTEQSIEFSPNHIISCADIPGTIEPGATYSPTLKADARNLLSGDEVSQTFYFSIDSDDSDTESEQTIYLGDSYTWLKSSESSDDPVGTGNTRDWYVESPTFSEPSAVYFDGAELTKASAPNKLTCTEDDDGVMNGSWAWGDSNDLGYDTLYVRIDTSVGGAIVTTDSNISVVAVGSSKLAVEVTFTATDSSTDGTSSADQAALAWGSDEATVTVVTQDDGSNLLSWDAASDGFERTYNIYYTLNLASDWIWLAETDEAVYEDAAHLDADSIFYKVTVQ
jgi:hypothetical protein